MELEQGSIVVNFYSRSRSKSPESTHQSRSGSRENAAGSQKSRSRNGSLNGSRSESHSRSGSRRRSRSGSPFRSRSRSGSRERSKSGSRSRSRIRSRSRTESRSRSGSPTVKRAREIHSDSEDAEPLPKRKARDSGSDNEEPAEGETESASENDENPECQKQEFVSDFDEMLARKREERLRQRKRRDIDLINDNDDNIAQLLQQMRDAAEEDRNLNTQNLPATKKISMLKTAMSQLIKKDLQLAFIEHNVLNVLTDWLAPLPNKSLPCFQIRDSILKLLSDFPTIDKSNLKQSGIGKAVMYLSRHPKETKENRERGARLISEWSRIVYNLSADFNAMTREERQERDLQLMSKTSVSKKQQQEAEEREKNSHKGFQDAFKSCEKTLRPGDVGWVPRARVPVPSTKDYVVRPKSTINVDMSRGKKKIQNHLEERLKRYANQKRLKNAEWPSRK